LDNIGAKQKRIMVFNKIDLLDKTQLEETKKHFPQKENVRVSVKEGTNLEEIKKVIIENI
jgi:50S ribosomal subunit-associated GTPase HflX